MSHPILSIIPNIGWSSGVNVNIVDANITDEEAGLWPEGGWPHDPYVALRRLVQT